MAEDVEVKCEVGLEVKPAEETNQNTEQSSVGNGKRLSESESDIKLDKQTLHAVLQFLKKHNLKETEVILKKEARVGDDDFQNEDSVLQIKTEDSVSSLYKCDGNPLLYEEQYVILKHFVENSLDLHKCELAGILYPIFVHVYLKLVFNDCGEQAVKFFEQYCHEQNDCYNDDLQQLIIVRKNEHVQGNQFLDNIKSMKFVVRLSRDSYSYLKRFLAEKSLTTVLTTIQEHLTIDVFEGLPQSKQQIETTTGALFGSVLKDANKSKVLYGLLKEPELNVILDDVKEDVSLQEDGKPQRKRKPKKDSQLLKKSKADPNAPPLNRIPLPELKDSDKLERAKALRELSRKVTLGPDSQPSVLFYTFINSYNSLTSVDICEDASLMCAGFSDSIIRVWTMNSNKLCKIKTLDQLNIIDKESDDVMERIMNDQSAAESRVLYGHAGPVYATCISPDKSHMVSSSADGTVRLWSLHTWTNLVSYKGHMYPVWAVKYGPHGHYFVSGGLDRTARLWSTDHHQPLRVFAGHLADIECVDFHPNSNYIVTGSTDRTIRLWDVLSGGCVRTMAGHKAPVCTTAFSPDGRYLASAGYDCNILLWDIATGELVSQLKGHTDTVFSLSFSREGSVLASGGKDNCIRLWDIAKVITNERNGEDALCDTTKDVKSLQIAAYSTKATAVQCVHFNRRNVLLAAGPFIAV